jgi:hypothetical protein
VILDTTCSSKRAWPAVADVRMDAAVSSHPEVLANAMHLPFRGGSFDRVYCDPPHLIDHTDWHSTRSGGLYFPGLLRFRKWETAVQYRAFLAAVNIEFARVLCHRGQLHFKTLEGIANGHTVRVEWAIKDLDLFTLESDQRERSRGPFSRINERRWGTPTWVRYLVFRKGDSSQ